MVLAFGMLVFGAVSLWYGLVNVLSQGFRPMQPKTIWEDFISIVCISYGVVYFCFYAIRMVDGK